MQLEVHRNGVKLFFVTIAVAGRRKVLSQVVAGEARPRLLPLGEVVKAGLLAIHKVWPAVGLSDYVVMPDHVHFLLVVDFLRDEGFNPLWATHRLLDAIEAAWDARGRAPAPPATPANGALPPATPANGALPPATPANSARPPATPANGALPPATLPDMVAALRAAVARGRQTAALLRYGAAQAGCGAVGQQAAAAQAGYGAASPGRPMPPAHPAIFERSPWLDLAFDPRQLKATRHYIRLNPDRYLWKTAHPDLFVCHRAIKAARLARFAPQTFDGLGNLPLLGSPFLFHVRLTLKKTVAEHAAAIAEIVDKARHGWVPVSGFISPGEREALRQLKAEPRARFIRLLPYALPPRYDPSAEDSREIAAGRMAILALHDDTAAISGLAMRRDAAAAHQFRANCLAMNDIGARLCESLA